MKAGSIWTIQDGLTGRVRFTQKQDRAMPRRYSTISGTGCMLQRAVYLLISAPARVFSVSSFCAADTVCMPLSRMRRCGRSRRKDCCSIPASPPQKVQTVIQVFRITASTCITAAQAFHWFDAEAFRKECIRIRRPGGRVIIVYNSRDDHASAKALSDLHRRYAPGFHGFSNGISAEKCRAFFAGHCEIFRADNSQHYDRQGYIDRVLSSSYSLCGDDDRYPAYLKEINAIFDAFAVNGIMTVPIHTVAYIGTV